MEDQPSSCLTTAISVKKDKINLDEMSSHPEKLADDQQTLSSISQKLSWYLQHHQNYVYYKISRKRWNILGSMIQKSEKGSSEDIDGTKWISLRLDGHGFSKKIRKLKDGGVLEPNFSLVFTEVMAESLKTLMSNWGATIGMTQSDEMTLLIPPAGQDKMGNPNKHQFSGRREKIISSCAGDLTSIFITNLIKKSGALQQSPHLLPTILEVHLSFDCRCAAYQTFEEAKGIIMWRAQDCFKNGVNDHVYHLHAKQPEFKEAMEMCTEKKMDWLTEINDLPCEVAMHGTWLVKERVEKQTINQKTKLEVTVTRIQYNSSSLRDILENPKYPELDYQSSI